MHKETVAVGTGDHTLESLVMVEGDLEVVGGAFRSLVADSLNLFD